MLVVRRVAPLLALALALPRAAQAQARATELLASPSFARVAQALAAPAPPRAAQRRRVAPPPPPTGSGDAAPMDPTQAQAREAFQRGLEQANNLQWSEASESFERSYQLYPRPQTLFNLGLAYRALGRYREGTETLERYLRDANVPPDLRAQVDEALAEMRRSVARITLNVVPANATVTVDEQPVRAGEELLLNPGNHTLGARAEGYANYARTLTVTRGETRHFDVNLDRRGGSVATQWWFWTIIGVVVAGGVVGTAVAVTREGPANCGSLGVCLTPQ